MKTPIGSFVLVDDLGRFEEGLFKGTKINTDLSAYTPARLQSDVEKCQRTYARRQKPCRILQQSP